MKHITGDDLHAYRIGWWTHRWWPRWVMVKGALLGRQPSPAANGSRKAPRAHYVRAMLRDLRKIRRPHRPWQAEYEDCRWAPRAFTADGVRRKAERDRAYQEATGQWSPWIQRRVVRRYGPDAVMGPVR